MQLRETSITFLNVGQGDAILIQQGRYQILIDGGKNGRTLLGELGRFIPFWDRHIEVIIPTHPDADHVGGLAAIPRHYSVGTVLFNGAEGESDYWKNFQESIAKEIPFENWQKLIAGSKIILPKGGEIKIIYPKTAFNGIHKDEDTNAGSVVALFTYGQTSFLLTGDLPYEETVLPSLAPVTVLKAAHHGSKFSTSTSFLKMIQPKEVIISVGENTYGHPHQDVLQRIESSGARILRTDQEGSLMYSCQHEQCFYQERF